VQKGETSIGEVIRIQCFDGTYKIIINSALPLYDDRGQPAGAIVVNEDITPLKETEAALRRAVQSREHVLEVVAHDLRQPLQVILTLVQALLLVQERRQDEREVLHDMHDQIRRMDRLIQDLLDVTQLESGAFRLGERVRIRPETLLDDIWRAHWHLASASSLELRREVQAGLPEISVDPDKIGRVFGNLIGNAVKFTPAGGRIIIGAAPDDGRVRFWVADTGRGIDAESLVHVFNRRWQAGDDRRGAGLGLAIAKSIVDAHGGRIWAESTIGRGTTIFFTLPSAGVAGGLV
jgi:signal transduction histidine kinase